jgi:hypothetical protein
MRYLKFLAAALMLALMAACGGGGGSSGTTSGTTSGGTGGTGGGGTTTPAVPTLTLSLVNSADAAVAGNAVTSGAVVFAKAVVKDATGAAVPNKLVSFISGSQLLTFQPASGQVLTDASGVAKVQVSPATLSTAGAETLTANATLDGSNLSAALDIQTSQANVSLANFVAGQTTLSAFQATTVSVDVAVNGATATTPVSVGFTANCGTFSPPTVNSNSNGKALSTFQATGCVGGNAILSASATGATPVQSTVIVQAAEATTLLFVSAAPSTIYTSAAAFGVKQSTVIFKVVDASGNAIGASTSVRVALSPSSIAAGVQFADTGNTTPKVIATDANGLISVIVKSGGVPTPLSLNAELVSNTNITASSAGLTVNSGRPVQSFFSLAASTFNIEGWGYDNVSSELSVLIADRLGQPVPEGTPITFITEGGQVTASCSVVIDSNGKSGCATSLISQAFRPTNGRVTVLAYTEGEEPYIDGNGNNRYDAGEIFFDMGQPFLDSNENGLYDAPPANEQKVGDSTVPGAGIGTNACTAHAFLSSNVINTCDGTWGPTRVRGRVVIVFSTSFALLPVITTTVTSANLTLSDQNGNAMPQGTEVIGTISGGTNCSIKETIPATVPNATNPTTHTVIVTKGSDPADTCTGAVLSIKATTPRGNTTLLGSVVMP